MCYRLLDGGCRVAGAWDTKPPAPRSVKLLWRGLCHNADSSLMRWVDIHDWTYNDVPILKRLWKIKMYHPFWCSFFSVHAMYHCAAIWHMLFRLVWNTLKMLKIFVLSRSWVSHSLLLLCNIFNFEEITEVTLYFTGLSF